MGRHADSRWPLISLAYLTGRCKSYAEVAKVFHMNVKTIEKRASQEGWYQQRMTGDTTGVLQNMILSVKSEDRDAIAELFKKKTDISLKMADVILTALTDKRGKNGKKGEKGKLNHIKSAFGNLQLATVAAKFMDQVQRAVEGQARVSSHLEGGNTPPLLIHAASGASVNVTQLVKAVRGKGKEKIV